jgi:nitroreductase
MRKNAVLGYEVKKNMELKDAIKKRKSIRVFQNKEVPDLTAVIAVGYA